MKKKPLKLQLGLRFKTNWKGCLEPKRYKIIEIDNEENSITVEVKPIERGTSIDYFLPKTIEVWPNADRLHLYFEIGDYKQI